MAKKTKAPQNVHLPESTVTDDEFYDNTAGTIFSADSDADTGHNKQAKKTAKKQQAQSNKNKPSKNKKPLIIAIVVVVLLACLIGLFFLIKNVVPDANDDTTAPTYPTD